MNNKGQLLAATMMMVSLSSAWAQNDTHTTHTTEDVVTEPMNHDAMPGMNHDGMSGMDEMNMEGMEMNHDTMPDQAPSSGLRDPHAYADGYDFSQFPMRHEAVGIKLGSLLVDRLEAVRADHTTSAAYDLQVWYGGDFDRAVLKAEGDIDDGKVDEASTELLWGHAIAAFWNTQLGLRYDSGEGPNRSWLAAGIQGLAPYWFEVDVTAYLGEEGHTALKLETEYELLLTQRLVLQPRIEADLYGKNAAERGQGAGLSELAAGLRLRYEIRREFAPYVGVEWAGKFGGTADYARDVGLETKETRLVAGVRFWF